MRRRFIDTAGQLTDLVEEWRDSDHVAVDTEFFRERTYYPKLCLVQLAWRGDAVCIDTPAIDDLSPLRDFLFDASRLKIFHAARQDLELFFQLWKKVPEPLFDTQIAAALLGVGDQIGYANLVLEMLELELPKTHTRSDWCKRPLDDGQLHYAYDDVVYLEELFLKMDERLTELGRESWLESDFAVLTKSSLYQLDPMEMWRRIKGRQKLKRSQLAVLQMLAAWREERAVSGDKPRNWIAKDFVLVEIARAQPESEEALRRVNSIDSRFADRWGRKLLELVREGRAKPEGEWPVDNTPNRLAPEQRQLLDRLDKVLQGAAAEHGIMPSLIGARRDLVELVTHGNGGRLFEGWRDQVVGKALKKVLQNEFGG